MASGNLLNGVSVTGPGAAFMWGGGDGTFEVGGTPGGSSIILQALISDGTWQPLGPDTTTSVTGKFGFYNGPGQLRANVSGGTPSGLYASVYRARRP